jgi:hypothetical protein
MSDRITLTEGQKVFIILEKVMGTIYCRLFRNRRQQDRWLKHQMNELACSETMQDIPVPMNATYIADGKIEVKLGAGRTEILEIGPPAGSSER